MAVGVPEYNRRAIGRVGTAAGGLTSGRGCPLHRIVLTQPLLNFFFLSGQDNTLPFHLTGPLAVLSHYVRAFIEDQDEAVRLSAFEVVRGGGSMVFLHHFL